MMNDYAEQIGLTGSNFVNPTGLPAEGHLMTPRDLAKLSQAHRSRPIPSSIPISRRKSSAIGINSPFGIATRWFGPRSVLTV